MQNGRIQDSQITASSIYRDGLSTKHGRLNSTSSWSAIQNNQSQWIQIDLGQEEVVTEIGTQGRGDLAQWVETYSASYGSNGNVFEPYKIDGVVKVRNNNCAWFLNVVHARRKCSGAKCFIFCRPRKRKIVPAPAWKIVPAATFEFVKKDRKLEIINYSMLNVSNILVYINQYKRICL